MRIMASIFRNRMKIKSVFRKFIYYIPKLKIVFPKDVDLSITKLAANYIIARNSIMGIEVKVFYLEKTDEIKYFADDIEHLTENAIDIAEHIDGINGVNKLTKMIDSYDHKREKERQSE